MVLPHFLGPKVLIIFFHCRPLFLAQSIFVMGVHVVPTVVVDAYQASPGCQPAGTIGVMRTSKQLLTGQGNMALLGLYNGIKHIVLHRGRER